MTAIVIHATVSADTLEEREEMTEALRNAGADRIVTRPARHTAYWVNAQFEMAGAYAPKVDEVRGLFRTMGRGPLAEVSVLDAENAAEWWAMDLKAAGEVA